MCLLDAAVSDDGVRREVLEVHRDEHGNLQGKVRTPGRRWAALEGTIHEVVCARNNNIVG